MFELAEEHRMLQDLVAKFIDRDVIPLEKAVLAREMSGQKSSLSAEEEATLLGKCRELGLWGLDVPEEFGGANLPTVALIGVYEEQGRTCVPFTFPPDSPNLHMLMAVCNPEQRRKYLEPYARGEAQSAIAISEPGAGGDPAGMITRAVKDGSDWVINGRKIWVSRVPQADFVILMARTGEGKRHEGVTAFIIERGTKGFNIEREIPMLGGQRTYELTFDDCRIPEEQILGQVGKGFAPMQLRLTVRRIQMGAWCVGMTRRALDMMMEHAKQRITFGQRLADRQAIQWWIAEAAIKIHACRLMVYDAADKVRRRQGRAHRGVHGEAVRHRDGDRDHRPRHADVRRHGCGEGAAATADGTEGAHHARLRRSVRSAPHGHRTPTSAGSEMM